VTDEAPIPAILLPPGKDGSEVPRAHVRNTNWKGVVGIVAAVVVAPNLVALSPSVPDGAPFATVLALALAVPLLAVLGGILMAYDIRNGAESSRRLALASMTVGILMISILGVLVLVLPGLVHGSAATP